MIGVDPDLVRFATRLQDAGIPCAVVGSLASSAFGEPRATLDVDLLIAAGPEEAERITAAFADARYYVPPLEVIRRELARGRRGTFNIIDSDTGVKADLYPIGDGEAEREGLAHRVLVPVAGVGEIPIASPTCVVIGKLRYFAMSRQDKHLRDIRAICKQSCALLDLGMIERHAAIAGVGDVWQDCLARPGEES